ncbi:MULTISPECIES: hypothetical protein [Serratia]|uniref:hypothetical protein n=1 Tax=Serratia TaxID=613 RepID=UPI0013A07DBE|nr:MULTISPECIES: hypothetical protein [Serratia]MBH2592678.1 hypothetical protein [Serratia marcescens]MDQ7767586.1 hypothetical protein [Serratia nevei]HAT3716077.1 hypothetical protein [Serratia marcescens]
MHPLITLIDINSDITFNCRFAIKLSSLSSKCICKATMHANRGSVSVTLSNCLSLAAPSQNMNSFCNYQERLSAVDRSKAIMSKINKLECPAPVKISAEASLKL